MKKIIVLTMAFFIASLLFSTEIPLPLKEKLEELTSENLSWHLPLMKKTPVIDGKINNDEWQDAVTVTGFLDLSGIFVPMRGSVSIGTNGRDLFIAVRTSTPTIDPGGGLMARIQKHDDANIGEDDSIEIMISPANDPDKVYHFILNSRDIIFDRKCDLSNKINDVKWDIQGINARSRAEAGLWDMELQIPFKSIGNPKEVRLNVARNWSGIGQSSITGAAKFLDCKNMLRIKWGNPAPAIEVISIACPEKGLINLDALINVPPEGNYSAGGIIKTDTWRKEGNKNIKSEKTVHQNYMRLKPGKNNFKIKYDFSSSKSKYYLAWAIQDRNGNVMFDQIQKFKRGRTMDSRPVTVEYDWKGYGTIYCRHYPGFNRAALSFKPLAAGIKDFSATLIDSSGREYSAPVKMEQGEWKTLIQLPDREETYSASLTLRDEKDNTASGKQLFSITRKKFDWENNMLGKDKIIIPPFIPLEIADGNIVKSILREHKINGYGLWDQVKALKADILEAPITLECIADNNKIKWKSSIPLITRDPQGYEIKIKGAAESGNVKWNTECTFDYDGFMWVKAALSAPPETTINKLTLQIPMKASETSLFHAVADKIRGNPSGFIPEGKNEVWNSKSLPRSTEFEAQFVPYIWMGAEERGICWMADSSSGFELDAGKPQIRILRSEQKTVTLEIDLINSPVKLNSQRNFEFGMMATPVKPMPEGWKNLLFGYGRDIPGMQVIYFPAKSKALGHFQWAHTPVNNDYSLIKYAKYLNQQGKPQPEIIDKWKKRNAEAMYNLAVNTEVRGNITRKNYKEKITDNPYVSICPERCFPFSDQVVPYTDPRLQPFGDETSNYFMPEWWRGKVGYEGAYRSYLTPSNIDYLVYSYYNEFKAGIDGIYLDDSFIIPCLDSNSSAKIDAEGKIIPEMGLLATRELVRRLAVIEHQLNKQPKILVVHMTNALLIPAFSFATVSYDWENHYGEDDVQDRFKLDEIRTTAIGRQLGAIPAVLGGVKRKTSSPEKWKENEFARVTRTALAMTLPHEIRHVRTIHPTIEWREVFKAYYILNKFGIQNTDCVFVPYWKENPDITACGGNFILSSYRKPGAVLIILSNMGAASTGKISLDAEKLNLPQGFTVMDAESGEPLSIDSINIPEHDFRLIFAGDKKEGKMAPSPDALKSIQNLP